MTQALQRHAPNWKCDGQPAGDPCAECGTRLCACERSFGHDCEVTDTPTAEIHAGGRATFHTPHGEDLDGWVIGLVDGFSAGWWRFNADRGGSTLYARTQFLTPIPCGACGLYDHGLDGCDLDDQPARLIHLQTAASHVRCGASMGHWQSNPDGWDLSTVSVDLRGVTCPDCRPSLRKDR